MQTHQGSYEWGIRREESEIAVGLVESDAIDTIDNLSMDSYSKNLECTYITLMNAPRSIAPKVRFKLVSWDVDIVSGRRYSAAVMVQSKGRCSQVSPGSRACSSARGRRAGT